MIPMFAIPIPFLFVLLILLLTKTPKVGTWVVGGLITAVSFGLLIFLPIAVHDGMASVPQGEELIPLLVVPIPFVFVLLVLLLSKAPKVGAGVIVGVVVMGLLGAYLWFGALQRPRPRGRPAGLVQIKQEIGPVRRYVGLETAYESLREDYCQAPVVPRERDVVRPAVLSPIWSEAMVREFDADVYPSKRAAVRAMGSRMDALIGRAAGDGAAPERISIFQEGSEHELVGELATAVQERFPQTECAVEGGLRNTTETEVGITLHLSDLRLEPVEWATSPRESSSSGRIEATVFGQGGTMSIGRRFAEKPWIADYASFANSRPGKKFAVARSRQTCTSENDAMEQALADAAVLLTRMIGDEMKSAGPLGSAVQVTSTDVLDGDLIVDQFVQGLAGSASKIWRSALLIDISEPKLAWLIDCKSRAVHSVRMTWVRMIGSAVGVVALIAAIYFFLNMATRGYYEWSLRIAGIVLAIVAVVSILMIVQ